MDFLPFVGIDGEVALACSFTVCSRTNQLLPEPFSWLVCTLAHTCSYLRITGALAYADDITLLAPTPSALRKLLLICEKFGAAHSMRFNPDKTQCIRFCKGKSNQSCDTEFIFSGKRIALATSVTHLGHCLSSNLQDEQDIQRCILDFNKRANSTLYRFRYCTHHVCTHLLRS